LTQLNVAEHLFAVKWQPDKGPILLIIHTDIWTVVLVAFIGFVVAAKFAIADLRVLDDFEQLGKGWRFLLFNLNSTLFLWLCINRPFI